MRNSFIRGPLYDKWGAPTGGGLYIQAWPEATSTDMVELNIGEEVVGVIGRTDINRYYLSIRQAMTLIVALGEAVAELESRRGQS